MSLEAEVTFGPGNLMVYYNQELMERIDYIAKRYGPPTILFQSRANLVELDSLNDVLKLTLFMVTTPFKILIVLQN